MNENDRFGLGDGLERNDGADRLGLIEAPGLPEFMDGLGRLNDGLERPIEGLGRLLMDGPGLGLGENALGGLDIRFWKPPPGALGLGEDWIIGEGPRLICGLGAEPNDLEPKAPPRFITEGPEGI